MAAEGQQHDDRAAAAAAATAAAAVAAPTPGDVGGTTTWRGVAGGVLLVEGEAKLAGAVGGGSAGSSHNNRNGLPVRQQEPAEGDEDPYNAGDDDDVGSEGATGYSNNGTESTIVRHPESGRRLLPGICCPPSSEAHHQHLPARQRQQREAAIRCRRWFFLLGVLNHMPYWIVLATAKSISEGGTAIVYVVTAVPGLIVKLSAPFWFDRVGYRIRMLACAASVTLAFLVVSYFTRVRDFDDEQRGSDGDDAQGRMAMIGQLVGVAFVSLQIGMGEASLLALAGKIDGEQEEVRLPFWRRRRRHQTPSAYSGKRSCCLGSFATGTGVAGPMGYLWKVSLTEWCGIGMSQMLAAGVLLTASYWLAFLAAAASAAASLTLPGDSAQYRSAPQDEDDDEIATAYPSSSELMVIPEAQELELYQRGNHRQNSPAASSAPSQRAYDEKDGRISSGMDHEAFVDEGEIDLAAALSGDDVIAVPDMTMSQRLRLLLSLWRYIVPLCTVYAAEYACQAGAWTAIGFPTVDSVQARAKFYEQSNWLYQAGSFVARASGNFLTIGPSMLWLLPVLQVGNLVFFSAVAAKHGFFYRRGLLLVGSLYTGLLGGAVYVHGYKRIIVDLPQAHTEFALSSTCVAETLGVLLADVIGLYLQSCLYSRHGLSGALVECPVEGF